MAVEYTTLGLYFIILLVLGAILSDQNKSLSDYVRCGAQGVWWLVGTSAFMSGISAFTFTGNASAAFEGGPTILIIYLANVIGLFVCWKWLAARYRRSRAYTGADVIRFRYGTVVEQFNVLASLFLTPLTAAVQLWALSVFASTVFGLPLQWTIVGIGCVVVFYSTAGGKWAVMATDFVQGLVMIPITILVAILALKEIGGLGAFFSHFTDPRFADDFRFAKEAGQFADNKFTWHWIIVIFLMQLNGQFNLGGVTRFLAAKDEKHASRAALLAAILMGVCVLFWFIPPMVARFMYEQEVLAMGVENPSDASYVFMALRVLPSGLVGILIAAMFSASMSSMDSGMNGQAGVIARNLIPRLREALGLKELTEKANLLICKVTSLILGVLLITYALMLSGQKQFSLFDSYLVIGSVVGLPLGLPMLAALYIKRLPYWSYFVIFVACLIPSAWSMIDASLYGNAWTIQDRSMWVFIAFILSMFGCMPFYQWSSKQYLERVEIFFRAFKTPVDFAHEIGRSLDYEQFSILGSVCLVTAILICPLFMVMDAGWEYLCVLFMVSIMGGTGLVLLYGAKVEKRSLESIEETPINK